MSDQANKVVQMVPMSELKAENDQSLDQAIE